jgi:hypothetical protein
MKQTFHGWAAPKSGAALEPMEFDPGAKRAEQARGKIESCGIRHSDLSMRNRKTRTPRPSLRFPKQDPLPFGALAGLSSVAAGESRRIPGRDEGLESITKNNMIRRATLMTLSGLIFESANLLGAVIPVTDANVLNGLSPYNWVCKDDSISSSVNGASVTLRLKGTRQVALQVKCDHLTTRVPTRFPIIAWSVNGGALQSHQLKADEPSVPLSSGVADPVIDLFIKGMSPFEDRFSGDVPGNVVKITGVAVDEGGSTMPPALPGKVWLNIGDSIMSGDGAAYAEKQGRPPDDAWAASEDGRASYGYLLAKHFGYRESRIAYGGYNWGGGMANVPALSKLIDQRTSTVSRLQGEALKPAPDVVLINLGENGAPADNAVIDALVKLRGRVGPTTKIIVMIPASGRGRDGLTRAFNSYKSAGKDAHADLVDPGRIAFATCDGQHPTAAGHEAVFKAVLPAFDAIIKR